MRLKSITLINHPTTPLRLILEAARATGGHSNVVARSRFALLTKFGVPANRADELLGVQSIAQKFDENELRDDHGRWSSGGGIGPASKLLKLDSPQRSQNQIISSALSNPVERAQYKAESDEADKLFSEGHTTKNAFTDSSGEYTPARKELHNQIIDKVFENYADSVPKEGEKPVLTIISGRGGSGKSSFDTAHTNSKVESQDQYDSKHNVILNSDSIKHLLPEFEPGKVSQIHDESSDILQMAIDHARQLGVNTVIDFTMSVDKTKWVNQFKKSGYEVDGYYVHRPVDLAKETTVVRWSKPLTITKLDGSVKTFPHGRIVPFSAVSSTSNETNFDRLIPHLRNWAVYDNSSKDFGFHKVAGNKRVKKFDENEARDYHGRWTSGGAEVDISSWKNVGPQKGSNPGGTYEDPKGNKYYVKFPQGNPDQVRTSKMADDVYRTLGIPAKESRVVTSNGKLGYSGKLIDAKGIGSKEINSSADVKSGYVADAYLANWDVFGSSYDNIMRDTQGRDYRIDNAGSMNFRAQGKSKNFPADKVDELESMIAPGQKGNQAYGNLSKEEIAQQAQNLVTKLTDDKITEIVKGSGFTGDKADMYVNTLKGRRDFIAKTFLQNKVVEVPPVVKPVVEPTKPLIESSFSALGIPKPVSEDKPLPEAVGGGIWDKAGSGWIPPEGMAKSYFDPDKKEMFVWDSGYATYIGPENDYSKIYTADQVKAKSWAPIGPKIPTPPTTPAPEVTESIKPKTVNDYLEKPVSEPIKDFKPLTDTLPPEEKKALTKGQINAKAKLDAKALEKFKEKFATQYMPVTLAYEDEKASGNNAVAATKYATLLTTKKKLMQYGIKPEELVAMESAQKVKLDAFKEEQKKTALDMYVKALKLKKISDSNSYNKEKYDAYQAASKETKEFMATHDGIHGKEKNNYVAQANAIVDSEKFDALQSIAKENVGTVDPKKWIELLSKAKELGATNQDIAGASTEGKIKQNLLHPFTPKTIEEAKEVVHLTGVEYHIQTIGDYSMTSKPVLEAASDYEAAKKAYLKMGGQPSSLPGIYDLKHEAYDIIFAKAEKEKASKDVSNFLITTASTKYFTTLDDKGEAHPDTQKAKDELDEAIQSAKLVNPSLEKSDSSFISDAVNTGKEKNESAKKIIKDASIKSIDNATYDYEFKKADLGIDHADTQASLVALNFEKEKTKKYVSQEEFDGLQKTNAHKIEAQKINIEKMANLSKSAGLTAKQYDKEEGTFFYPGPGSGLYGNSPEAQSFKDNQRLEAKKLNSPQINAIQDYTGSGYRELNKAIGWASTTNLAMQQKNPLTPDLYKTMGSIDSALETTVLGHNIKLNRVMGAKYMWESLGVKEPVESPYIPNIGKATATENAQSLVGKVYMENAFSSTSANPEWETGFSAASSGSGKMLLRIRAGKDIHGLWAPAVPGVGHEEAEVILARNMAYVIRSIKNDGYKWLVDVDAIGSIPKQLTPSQKVSNW